MSRAEVRRFSLHDLRAARASGVKVPMLTCYDYTMARLMEEARVPMLLVGDSAASVILGHESTLPMQLPFLIELTAGVRRGAPSALVMGDMPFGSFHASTEQAVGNVIRMVQLSGCDCVKMEVSAGHAQLVQVLADAGVAVVAHLGLRPQSVGVLGGYRSQGRTARAAADIVTLARRMEDHGASAILLEAVPAVVSEAVVSETSIPVIGCGAGPACHAHVVVTHDLLRLTPSQPKFVPQLGEAASLLKQLIGRYVDEVCAGRYPAREHEYEMPPTESEPFSRWRQDQKAHRNQEKHP
ncbi:MAG: 3-methyl-2-oxobutanoate hydroxymethyltransferase [Phycisphaerae bacterium]|nr:3-methyl-2-oxobutanoate hydroxymethyltransferase [Phycisphaerae bacterium]MDW8261206.1 3-methyl-2-oxobutanoate hydroxymethyltransferase [Phycisphaerales bacterium]